MLRLIDLKGFEKTFVWGGVEPPPRLFIPVVPRLNLFDSAVVETPCPHLEFRIRSLEKDLLGRYTYEECP